MRSQTIEQLALSDRERSLLKDFAEDVQVADADTDALAQLERLGLLMRGWAGTHIVTALGQRVLKS